MGKIGFTDLITLAKSGWTPEKVNETLDRFEAMNSKGDSEDDDSKSQDDDTKSQDDDTESKSNEPANEQNTSESKEDEKDKKIKDLESKIENLQTQLSHQNNDSAEKKTVDDMVDDIFKEFFD